MGLVGGWSLHRVADATWGYAPAVSWSQVLAPYVAAGFLGVLAWVTWGQLQPGGSRSRWWSPGRRSGHARLDFQRSVNRLVLARACALVGALLAGGYFGFAMSWLFISGDYALTHAIRAAVTGLGGTVMTLSALMLQRACRVRSGDEST